MTENPLCLGGDNFSVPTNAGNIRAIKHSANLNAALGEGQLFIFTRKTVYSLTVPNTRTDWINATATNQPLQTVVQIVNGSVNDISVVPVNGDLFYQLLEPAIRTLQVSVRNFGQWGNTPISQNEQRALQVNDRSLMRFSSGITFDNRLLQLVLPKLAADGVNVVHQAILPLDFDVVSNLNTQDQAETMAPPVWEGAYDGLQFLQLFEGDFGGRDRAFASVISEMDGKLSIWELTVDSRTENGDNRVLWGFESPAFTWATSALEFKRKHLKGGELWVDKIFGTVNIDVYYREDADPCWRLWFNTEVCAGRDCQEVDPVCIAPYPPPPFREGYKFPIVFPEPKPACDSMGVRPTTIGYQFQVKVILKGWCRVRGLILYAMPHTEPQYHGIACPPASATPQDMRRLPIIPTPLPPPALLPPPPTPPPPPPPTPFAYVPPNNIIAWTDKNGVQFKNSLAEFNATADFSTVSEIDIENEGIATIAGLNNFPLLTILDLSLNNLVSLDISGTHLTYLNVSGNKLPVNQVNLILSILAANGKTGGIADTSSQTPVAAPSAGPPDGIAAKSALQSETPAWTVTTD